MKNPSEWNITDKRYVGYIDIMGFKDLVQRSDHEEIYSKMKTINEKAQENININWNEGENEDFVTVTNYSDSIIIYSKDSSSESCDAFLATMAGLSSDLFLTQIPHRGSFAFGKMTLDTQNSIFFGQPLIDAYLLEAELYFYGIVGHSSAEKEILELSKTKKIRLGYYVDYLVPFKGTTSRHVTIPPIFSGKYPGDNMYLADEAVGIKEQYQALKKSIYNLRYSTSGILRRYVDNTIEYHRWLETNLEK